MVTAFAVACAGTRRAPDPYLSDAHFRRAALVASLVNTANGYSQLRISHYDTGDAEDWSRLPEWNPRVEGVRAGELDTPEGAKAEAPLGAGARPVAIDAAALDGDEASLVALGEEAFFRYPVQTSLSAETATVSRDTFARYGFWIDEKRGAGGLVRAETANGDRIFAYTCATCHSAYRGGKLVIGVGNDLLNLGRLAVDAAASPDSIAAARWLDWGPGRVDVSTSEGLEPVRIADVRPTRWLTHLHADATVAVRDRTALAIRLETLIVTSHHQLVRPPRIIALGLAAYLESLASELPTVPPQTEVELHGANVFHENCASCHVPPAFTGAPVPLHVVGTNSYIGLSPDRGTGTYRVPSLRGVATRGPLLHDASLPGLDAMFDPARTTSTYEGGRLGPGAVSGHPYGLRLREAERLALTAYLQTL